MTVLAVALKRGAELAVNSIFSGAATKTKLTWSLQSRKQVHLEYILKFNVTSHATGQNTPYPLLSECIPATCVCVKYVVVFFKCLRGSCNQTECLYCSISRASDPSFDGPCHSPCVRGSTNEQTIAMHIDQRYLLASGSSEEAGSSLSAFQKTIKAIQL